MIWRFQMPAMVMFVKIWDMLYSNEKTSIGSHLGIKSMLIAHR